MGGWAGFPIKGVAEKARPRVTKSVVRWKRLRSRSTTDLEPIPLITAPLFFPQTGLFQFASHKWQQVLQGHGSQIVGIHVHQFGVAEELGLVRLKVEDRIGTSHPLEIKGLDQINAIEELPLRGNRTIPTAPGN